MDAELAAVRGTKPESLVSDEDWEKTWKALGRPDEQERLQAAGNVVGEDMDA